MSDSTAQTWFITGASSGFGEALADYVLEKGGRVAATFRKPEQAAEFTKKLAGRTLGVVADVTNEPQVKTAVAEAIAHFGQLDVIVNNAGYGQYGRFLDIADVIVN